MHPLTRRNGVKCLAAGLAAMLMMTAPALADGVRCLGTGHDVWPPFSKATPAKTLEGAAHDIMSEALARVGMEYVPTYVGPWRRAFASLEAGAIDMIVAATPNPEREAAFALSIPYAVEEIAIIVRQDSNIQFRTLDDLKGLRATVARGVSLGSMIDQFIAEHLEVIESADSLKMLLSGRVDLIILPRIPMQIRIRNLGVSDRVRVLERPLNTTEVAAVMRRGSVCAERLPEINAALQAMQADGTLNAIMERHGGMSVASAPALGQ